MSKASKENLPEEKYSEYDNKDVFLYAGQISSEGFTQLADAIQDRVVNGELQESAVLILVTLGGDPHAGYQMARMLQKYYSQLIVAIPGKCKSAGTLIAIAANELVFGPLGELGPLDIQTRKKDEMGEQSSTLDIFKALDNLQVRVIESFRHYVTDIKYGSGVNTKMASEIASTLTESLVKPISEQIDPLRLGEQKRALRIANEYASRLNEWSKNLQNDESLKLLIESYPSHSFVIDQIETKSIFNNTRDINNDFEFLINTLSLKTIKSFKDEIKKQKFIAVDFTELYNKTKEKLTEEEVYSEEKVKNIEDAQKQTEIDHSVKNPVNNAIA